MSKDIILPTEPGSVVRWYATDSGWWQVAILTLNNEWRRAGAWENGDPLTEEQLLAWIGDNDDDPIQLMVPGRTLR